MTIQHSDNNGSNNNDVYNDPNKPDLIAKTADGDTVTMTDAPEGTEAVFTKDGNDTRVKFEKPPTVKNGDAPPPGAKSTEDAPDDDDNDDGGTTATSPPKGKTATPPPPTGKGTAPAPGGKESPPSGKQQAPAGKEAPPAGKEPPPAGKKDTPPTNDKNDYTTPYKKGDKVDDKMLKELEDAGGKRSTEGGKDGVTMTNPDGTTTRYNEGDVLTQHGADKARAAGVEKHEKGTGSYYQKGDQITDTMKQDLKDKGWKEEQDGTITSPDGQTHIKPEDKQLSPSQAEGITADGVQKSPQYVRENPNAPGNREAPDGDTPFTKLSDADSANYGYTKPDYTGDKPTSVSWHENGDGEYVGQVAEYNPVTGSYGIAGEIHPDPSKASGYTFSRYSDDQYRRVNYDASVSPGQVW